MHFLLLLLLLLLLRPAVACYTSINSLPISPSHSLPSRTPPPRTYTVTDDLGRVPKMKWAENGVFEGIVAGFDDKTLYQYRPNAYRV
jgi:hypothetical protein